MARSTLLRTVILGVVLALAVIPGCAKQGEGERCEPNAAGNTDCEEGLICVADQELLDKTGANDFGRCCPPLNEAISDERCTRAGGLSGSAGSGGMSAAAGAAGEPGTAGTPAEGGTGGDPSTGGMSGGGAGGDSAAGAAGAGMSGAGGDPSMGGMSGASTSAGAGGA